MVYARMWSIIKKLKLKSQKAGQYYKILQN